MVDPDQWRGYFAASPTPFRRDGSLDRPRLRSVLRWFVGQRPHGMVVNGTTGEWVAQTVEERKAVLETARDETPHDCPLLVGIGSIRPDETVALGQHAADAGADGVLLTVPPGRWMRDDDIVDYFGTMSARVPLPLLVYNVPIVVGTDLSPALLGRLLEIDGVVGVKDNTPSAERRASTLRGLGATAAIFSDVLEPSTFPIFADEGRGRGQIGSGMPFGRRLAHAFEAVWSGDIGDARKVVDDFTAFKAAIIQAVGRDQPWHSQIKAIMLASGVDAGFPRFPSPTIRDDDSAMERVRAVVATFVESE